MPDLLSHVLVAYAVVRLLGWRWEWLSGPYVTVGMVGAVVPDVSKLSLFVDDDPLEAALGMPLEWLALHTGGGIVVSICIGVLLVASSERRRVFALLAAGALTHVALDALLKTSSGRIPFAVFWPLTTYRPPTPAVYLSTDWWPTLGAATLAGVVWIASERRRQRTDRHSR